MEIREKRSLVMREIFKLSREEIIIDQLFIQPTYWCRGFSGQSVSGRNIPCNGGVEGSSPLLPAKCPLADICYVRAHQEKNEHRDKQLSLYQQVKLFRMFYSGPHWANQISISVDELPEPVDEVTLRQRRHMIYFLVSVLNCLNNKYKPDDAPEVHLTMRSPRTLEDYMEAGIPFSFFSAADLISFSDLSSGPVDTCTRLVDAGVQVNYNRVDCTMLPRYLPPVSSIYTLVEKPHGKLRGIMIMPPNDFFQWDICLHHLENNNCNANISKFQVWPDGSVSGCPYKETSDTGPTLTAEGVVDNILKSSRCNNFEECCLK